MKPDAPATAQEQPTNPATTPTPAPVVPVSTPSKKSRLKVVLITAIAAVVVLGGGAAAYFGVVVPNKPENKLKKAVENLASQKTATIKGSIKVDTGGASVNLAINMLHVDPEKQAALADFALTFSGVTIPAEVRYIDSNVYVKLGDVSTLKSLASAYSGVDSQVIDQIASKVSNQWIEIDQTLLKQASSGAQTNMACSSEETTAKAHTAANDLLKLATDDQAKAYTITETSKEDVDGVSTTKLELALDEAKLKEFGTKAGELQSVKDLEKCLSSDDASKATDEAEDGDITKFNVWIDGDKRIKRVEMGVTAGKDSEKSTTTIDLTMVKDAPTVEKPSGAKPVMQLYGELQSLFSGGSSSLDTLNSSLSL